MQAAIRLGGDMQFQEIAAQGAAAGGAAAASAHEFSQEIRPGAAGISAVNATSFGDYKVIRRNGSVVSFEPSKIAVAMTKAFIAVRGGQGAGSAAVREQVEKLTDGTVRALLRRLARRRHLSYRGRSGSSGAVADARRRT